MFKLKINSNLGVIGSCWKFVSLTVDPWQHFWKGLPSKIANNMLKSKTNPEVED